MKTTKSDLTVLTTGGINIPPLLIKTFSQQVLAVLKVLRRLSGTRKNLREVHTRPFGISRELHPPIPPSANPDWNGEVYGFDPINNATYNADSLSMVKYSPRQATD